MITAFKEYCILLIHFISLAGDLATIYFNNNNEIILLGLVNSVQHLTKILRIIGYGFLMVDSPSWFCYLYSFINSYTNNTTLTISCLIIFVLFAALFFPGYYSDNYYKIKPTIYGFVFIYNGIFALISLYEPLIMGYSSKYIAESFNCSSGYRHRLYQFILGSSIFNIPFNFIAIVCTGVIIYKIFVAPRKAIKRQITTRVKMSFSRSVKILCFCAFFSLIAFFNLYNDINNGIAVEKGVKKEYEAISVTYILTATSGIFIFIFTNSFNQIKRKFGYHIKDDDSINDDTECMLPINQEDFDSNIYYSERLI